MYILKIDGFGLCTKEHETFHDAFNSAKLAFFGPFVKDCRYIEIIDTETKEVVHTLDHSHDRLSK